VCGEIDCSLCQKIEKRGKGEGKRIKRKGKIGFRPIFLEKMDKKYPKRGIYMDCYYTDI
jgi:hypothetical protein